jgi:hypothetical protein
MADVTGRIGNEEVEFNNAATEATLKMLLQATLASAKGSKEELNKIAAMAAKAGLDGDSINQANQAVQATTPQMNALGKTAFTIGAAFGAAEKDFQTLVKTGQQLAAGTAQASDVLSNLATMLPGPLGKVVQGFSALAAFQEGMLTQYQGLTKAGVNFGGSLTDLRMAASNSYLTMQEFSTLMSSNSATLSKMGGSVNDGAKAFSKASNELGASKLGTDLRALGYTSLEVNQGMMDYISISGGRNRKEMQDTDALAKGAGQYMEQLDGLAKLTGESREALAAKMKEDAANQAWQGYLLTLDVKDRDKASAARLEAEARGGKGAADALQAKLMGLPPMTEAGQKFVGTMQNGNKAIDGLAANVKDTGKTVDDVKKSGASFSAGLAQDGRNLKQVANAQIMAGKDVELFGKALKATNDATRNNITSAEEQYAFEQKIVEESNAQKESEAKAAVESKKALEELGQGILKMVMPFVKMLLPVVNALAPLAPAIMAVVAALAAYKGAMAAGALLGGGGGGIPGMPGGGGGGVPTGAAGGLGGMGSAMKGAAGGLRAFANPMVIAGAAGFGVAIAAIGAGIAGAAWLMGKALPTLAEGLMKFTEIDGGKLGAAAFGVAKLGVGLLPLAPFAIWGLPAAFAMNQLADGVTKLAAIDPGRLEKVAAGMEKIKAATPSIGDSIKAGIAGLVSKVTGTADAATAPETGAAASGGGADLNILVNEMKRLNTVSSDMLKFLKETADQTRRTADATKALNGDQFRF